MKLSCDHNFPQLLRNLALKVTQGRIAILELLDREKKPLSILQISKGLKGNIDQTTIYRTLESLVIAGVVEKINLQNSHTSYELTIGHSHHHHLVCNRCGKTEDIANCDSENFQKLALKKSKEFSVIKNHSLEYFGVCRTCVQKNR